MPRRQSITVGTLLRASTAWLQGHGFDEPRITCDLLLAHALGVNRAGLYARLGDAIDPQARKLFEDLLTRRVNGEPVHYILGEREFYGIQLTVRPAALIPRPETELLVEEVLTFARQIEQPRVIEIGTGSGAVAIALALHLPRATICATDLSPSALDVALENVQRHSLAERIQLKVADLLDGVEGEWDVVVANLPYIPTRTVDGLDRSICEWEPRVALDGGPDGLTPHERLLGQLPRRLRPGGMVILEVADDRGHLALSLFEGMLPGARIDLLQDMFARDRAVRAILPS